MVRVPSPLSPGHALKHIPTISSLCPDKICSTVATGTAAISAEAGVANVQCGAAAAATGRLVDDEVGVRLPPMLVAVVIACRSAGSDGVDAERVGW